MDREEQKYQQIGFTIRTIYDAIGQGIADLDDLQRMFFKALPDMPKNVVEDIIKGLQVGIDQQVKAQLALGGFMSDEVNLERSKKLTKAFLSGITGQDPNEITVDVDESDLKREADAEYASALNLTERQYEFEPTVTDRGLADAAWEKYKETGDADALLTALETVDFTDQTAAGPGYTFGERYASGMLQYYGLQDDLQLINYKEAAKNQNLVPVFNFGIASSFLAGLEPGRVANIQDKLMRAGFLQPGSYVLGTIGEIGTAGEDATIEALESAFSYLNTKPEYGLDVNDLREINLLSGGEEGVFLGFMRNYFEEIIEEVQLRDTNPIITAPALIAQANPDFIKFNVNQTVRETIGANPSMRDYQVIADWANGEIERLGAAYVESRRVYEQARVDMASQAYQDQVAGTQQDYYLLPPAMSDDDVSSAFSTGLDEFVYNYFKPLIDEGKEAQAYQQGLGVAIASLSR